MAKPIIDRGSIPAWAGEPARGVLPVQVVVVYPRVGGGAIHVDDLLISDVGLSPRGRGSL